ncbi:hypothetical protein [Colwellia sp. E2M01]|uniref:hypothetical protein n=1 Tax=Colwellia sp. E2M01 TaxID=2841561 RepID=UPI001C08C70A|nr:hypothetical protein [Colwellia sp. E2M01]MBU2871166.1 hypothetical protein [Colwellia sp. E2M01]
MDKAREQLLERREDKKIDTNELWEELTLAQKFAANSLLRLGYDLNWIRDVDETHLAILRCNDNVAVISKEGEVDTQPSIHIRL